MLFSFKLAYTAWNRSFRNEDCKLFRLPEEILVDEIFQWLSVRDIVRLRQVCKALAFLTKKPAVWKRFLPFVAQLRQPLAPLPPTEAYNLLNLTGLEMEAVVSRAISYDMTWKHRQIQSRVAFSVYAQNHVEEMVILPGGHFLAMSIRTFDGRYGISIWSLEHRTTRKPAPLLYRDTEVKAYGLTAKYMMIGRSKALVVAFLRKRHKDANDTRHIPETFEMGGKEDPEDPYMPIKYECTVLAVALRILDFFNDRNVKPMTDAFEDRIKFVASSNAMPESDIWRPLARIRTPTQLGVASLDVIWGGPYVCVVKRPDKIVFQPLNLPGVRSILECQPMFPYEETGHSIWNFRVLPEQEGVLVVRNIEKDAELAMENDHLVIELYRIPELGETLANEEATAYTVLTSRQYLNAQISEVQRTMPSAEDDSITPDLKLDRPPQPLSLFLRTQTGMAHRSLWPSEESVCPNRAYPTRFIYNPTRYRHIFFSNRGGGNSNEGTLDGSDSGQNGRDEGLPRRRKDDYMRFIPGSRRAFVYAVPRNYRSTHPPITACWGFQYNNIDRTAYLGDPVDDDGTDLLEVDVLDSPLSSTSTLPGDPDVPFHLSLDVPPSPMERKTMLGPVKLPANLREKLLYGVSGISFDEDSGRLVIATKVDNRLHVVDFAGTRPRDADDIKLDETMDEALRYKPEGGILGVY